jgi:hypothetical protein
MPAAREAIVRYEKSKGIEGIEPDDVFIGNGVSEVVNFALMPLLNPGDEVLIPTPSYSLWGNSVLLAGATPVDFVVGTLASFLAATFMWNTRHITIKGYPLLGMLMPALTNGILVGWQLTVYFNVDISFWVNALCVATGELAVLLVLGTLLFYAIRRRHLDKRLFY